LDAIAPTEVEAGDATILRGELLQKCKRIPLELKQLAN
jgi:hypothetical protein